MHDIEPFYRWRNLYESEHDSKSPFYGRAYSEFYFQDAIYNHVIHPQWDNIGSSTLFIKIIFADYELQYAIIELFGEWNDTLYNDIQTLKRNIIDVLIDEGIDKFILIGENVLNYHSSDDAYFEEWFDDVEDGWIAVLNFRDHVLAEFKTENIDQYFVTGGVLDDIAWRSRQPEELFFSLDKMIQKRLNL